MLTQNNLYLYFSYTLGFSRVAPALTVLRPALTSIAEYMFILYYIASIVLSSVRSEFASGFQNTHFMMNVIRVPKSALLIAHMSLSA